jgi:membrane protease subunit (stomatin/prohibitin family)
MPGLLRGMARTAVVAGTATAVSNNVSRRQAQRWANEEQGQQGYSEPSQSAQPAQTDPYAELEKLGQLKQQGIISQEEFDAKKRQLLGI